MTTGESRGWPDKCVALATDVGLGAVPAGELDVEVPALGSLVASVAAAPRSLVQPATAPSATTLAVRARIVRRRGPLRAPRVLRERAGFVATRASRQFASTVRCSTPTRASLSPTGPVHPTGCGRSVVHFPQQRPIHGDECAPGGCRLLPSESFLAKRGPGALCSFTRPGPVVHLWAGGAA